MQVVDATPDGSSLRWAQLSGWKVPVVAADLQQLETVVIAARRDAKIATIIVDTADLTRDPAGLVPLLAVATDVFLTVAASSIDAAKVQPLISTLFQARGRLERARAFKTQVLLNQDRHAVTEYMADLLDPDRRRILPFSPTIPALESYAQGFGQHPREMVDGSFHLLAASLLGGWSGAVTRIDPRPAADSAPRRAVILPGTRKLSWADA